MRKIYTALLPLLLSAPGFAQSGKIDFAENKGQWDAAALYRAQIPGGALFLTREGWIYSFTSQEDIEELHHSETSAATQLPYIRQHAYRVSFHNQNNTSGFYASDMRSHYENYFIGKDSGRWASEVRLFGIVEQQDIYNNIDLKIYSSEKGAKYDFIVKPGGNPKDILLVFDGVHPRLTREGAIKITTTVNEITEDAPYAYQVINGEKRNVPCNYVLKNNELGFSFPEGYNHNYELIIDPTLVFSTYSGSTTSSFLSYTTTYDLQGNLYSAGLAFGPGLPTTLGAFQSNFDSLQDVGIIKYNANGTNRLYATYYGGNRYDVPHTMLVNNNNELIVAGTTASSDLAIPSNAYKSYLNSNPSSADTSTDLFIAKFNASGSSLLAGTYIGGSAREPVLSSFDNLDKNYRSTFVSSPCEIVQDDSNHIWMVSNTRSSDFPVTANAFQTSKNRGSDGVILKLNTDFSQLLYSTYFGGDSTDAILDIKFNTQNQMVICGATNSTDLATSDSVVQPLYQGGSAGDGFVSVIDIANNLVLYTTYLGTSSNDHAVKLLIQPNTDNIYVLGRTVGNYPVIPGNYNIPGGDLFVNLITGNLDSFIISTRIGSVQNNPRVTFFPTAFGKDYCNNIYVTGISQLSVLSGSFMPVTNDAYQSRPSRFWFGVFNESFTSLNYGTHLGGVQDHTHSGINRVDHYGVLYHSVCSTNPSFPITPSNVWAPVKRNGNLLDMISFKFDLNIMDIDAAFSPATGYKDTGCAPHTVMFENKSVDADSYIWEFGNGDSSSLVEPSYTYALPGIYKVTLWAINDSCNLWDSASMYITVQESVLPAIEVNDTFLCDPVPVQLQATVSNWDSKMQCQWEPAAALLSPANHLSVTANPAVSTRFTFRIYNAFPDACVDSAYVTAHIYLHDYSNTYALPVDTTICFGESVLLRAYGGRHYLWSPAEYLEDHKAAFTYAQPPHSRDYRVRIASDSGCVIEQDVHITVAPYPEVDAGPDKIVKRGDVVQLQGTAQGQYFWEPADEMQSNTILNPWVQPLAQTAYYLTAISEYGCIAIDTVWVFSTDIFLPNAFSPNSDGLNDQYKIYPLDEHVILKEFSIYNRYGEKVFTTTNIQEGWNGLYKDKICDTDVYFYYVQYAIGEKYYYLKGDVTLLR